MLLWEENSGSVTWSFNSESDAIYNVSIKYLPLPDNGSNIEIGLMVDGEYPFKTANSLELPRLWCNEGDIKTDDKGNQYAPNQTEVKGYKKSL